MRWLIGPLPFPYLGFDFIAEFTYLIPSSQDFFAGFPHDTNVVTALDKVQPVPVSYTHLTLPTKA